MRIFIILFLYVVFLFSYFELLTTLLNAQDTFINYVGLLSIPTFAYISHKIHKKTIKIINNKKDENEKIN